MRRFVLLMAACGSGSSTEQKPPPEPAPIAAKKPLGPITGAHGGPINAIAVTSDGRAAVTADITGGMRLWPTLDGTREPIVIKAASPAALAIAHDASGFAIAVTDSANQVELVRLDNKGEVRTRRKFGEAAQL